MKEFYKAMAFSCVLVSTIGIMIAGAFCIDKGETPAVFILGTILSLLTFGIVFFELFDKN